MQQKGFAELLGIGLLLQAFKLTVCELATNTAVERTASDDSMNTHNYGRLSRFLDSLIHRTGGSHSTARIPLRLIH